MIPRKVAIAAFVLVLMLAPLLLPDFQITLLDYAGIGSLVAIGLVLLTGLAGLTSFGQAAFVGIGAFTTAYLTTRHGLSPWVTLPVALGLSGVTAWLIGWLTLGLKGHYLPVATIAWSLALYYAAGTIEALGGHDGINGIPPLAISGLILSGSRPMFWLIWGLVLLAVLAAHNLLHSRLGRAIRLLRGRRMAAEAFGVDTAALRRLVFVAAALLAALAGWLYAHLVLFVNPTPFGLSTSIDYLFMTVIGGAASLWGGILGAVTLTIARDRLQDALTYVGGGAGAIEQVALGVVMVLILQKARFGIAPVAARLLRPATPIRILSDAAALPLARPAQSDAPLMSVDGLSRRFGGLVAVDNVAFDLKAGEIVGLIGPNGAGKSTLFNLLTGVLPADAGRFAIAGTSAERLSSRAIAGLGIARTFQHVQLKPDMTALENVALGAHRRASAGALSAIFKLNRQEEASIFAEAQALLARVGLADLANRPAGELALGQQRLLEIARALAAAPRLLLLDEPAAGLRHMEKQALGTLLADLRSEGLAVLIVEHDMSFVMDLVDRLVVLEFGTRIAEGSPADIRSDPRVIAAYLG